MHDQDHGKMTKSKSRLWVWALAAVLAGAGAAVSFGATAGLRDYDSFTLGFANVTGGREDKSLGLLMYLSFEDLSVMGFAPVLSLRHGKTQSNISRYQTTTTGVSLGISSVF